VALKAAEWTRIQELFHSLADRSQAEQSEELDRLSTDEPDVAHELRGMLLADASGASLLDRGIAGAANDLLRPVAALPPHRFGPYRIERLLGEGGMGVVYLGTRDDLGSRAAIKILANAWLSPARRERFRLETQTLSALDHPSIARLLDADHLPDGTPWFAMEYVEGEPITVWARRQRLGLRQVLELFVGVCDAVEHAHGRAVIHRDIKPSNVLVTSSGAIKLLDFGIAKRFRDAPGTETRSRTVMRLLTPQYAAPEQLEGRVVGVAADVYALGVMLFELIAGRRPYEVDEGDGETLATKIRAAYPPHVRKALRASPLGGGLPKGSDAPPPTISADGLAGSEWSDIDALFATALAPEPEDRYRSVEAFRADIERFLHHQPLAARTATLGYRARKFLRRRWRGVALGAAAAGIAGVGLTVYNRNLAAARDVAVAEAARTTRVQQFLVNLFQGGPQGVVPGDSLRLATVVQNGIREARGLASDSVTHAELVMTLGIISEQIGNAPQADSLYLQAIGRTRALYGPNHPETVRALVRRAALLAKLDKGDSALLQLARLDTLARASLPADHPAIAELDEAYGKLLAESGQIPRAVPMLRRAVAERARADSTSREHASALRELGNAMAYGGQWQQADSVWRIALTLEERLSGPQHPNVGFLLTNLGTVASMRGDLPTAERDLRGAVAISAGWFGEHHWLTAAARLPLAQTLVRQQKYAEAVTVLRGMIADYGSQPLPTGAVAMNLVQNALGNALRGLGDRAGARTAFAAAAADLRATLGPTHMNTLLNESSIALLLIDDGKADSAIAMYGGIIERGTSAYGLGHPEVAGFRLRLGRALFLAKRPREAIESITAGLRVLDSAKAGRPDDVQRALAILDTAYRSLGDTAKAAEAKARLDRLLSPATR
jgi:eukaryotic-like serine/threonine-protein kinase